MIEIYSGQTYTITVTIYSPATSQKVSVTAIKLDIYKKVSGSWVAVETNLDFDENDGVGIYKKYHYFNPTVYAMDNQILRIIPHWTLMLEAGNKEDLEVLEVKLKIAH